MRLDARWFLENGCELAEKVSPMLLLGIYNSEGDPCRRCNCKRTCPAWPKRPKAEAEAESAA